MAASAGKLGRHVGRPKFRSRQLAQLHRRRVLVGVGDSYFPYDGGLYFSNFGPPHPVCHPSSFGARLSVRVHRDTLDTTNSPLQLSTLRAPVLPRLHHHITYNPSTYYMPTNTPHVLTNIPHWCALYSRSPGTTSRFTHVSRCADPGRAARLTLAQTQMRTIPRHPLLLQGRIINLTTHTKFKAH